MTPKDKQLYEIMLDRKEDFINDLKQEVVPMEFEEILYHISRAEYKRGKADGISENKPNTNK